MVDLPNLPNEILLYEVSKWLSDVDRVMLDVALNNYHKVKPQWLKRYPMGMQNKDVIGLSDVRLRIIIRCGLVNNAELSWKLAEDGRLTILEWYIANNLPIHRCAIDYCSTNGRVDCLKLLLDAGYSNKSMLGYAVSNGHLNCLQLLYERGKTMSDVDHTNDWLHNALKGGRWDCLEFLYNNDSTYLKRNLSPYVLLSVELPVEQYPMVFKLLLLNDEYDLEYIIRQNIPFVKYIVERRHKYIKKDIANRAIAGNKLDLLPVLLDNNFKVTKVERLVYTRETHEGVRKLLIDRRIIPAEPTTIHISSHTTTWRYDYDLMQVLEY